MQFDELEDPYLQAIQEDTDYSIETERDGGISLYNPDIGESFRLLSGEGNISKEAACIFDLVYGMDSGYGIGDLIETKFELIDRGILDDNGNNLDLNIDVPEPVESCIMAYGSKTHFDYDSALKDEKGDMQENVAEALEEVGGGYASSSHLAGFTEEMSANTISAIFRKWEVENDLDKDESRLGRTDSITWNTDYLFEEAGKNFLNN